MRPTREEIAMILLEEDLDIDRYLKIGKIHTKDTYTQLKVVGYPSVQYKSNFNFDQV